VSLRASAFLPLHTTQPHKLVVEAIKAKTLECDMIAPMVFAEVTMEWLPAGASYPPRP